MTITDVVSQFFEQMSEPFKALYSAISQYLSLLWNSLTVFQKVLISIVLYLPIIYLIFKILKKIRQEKERQYLNYLLMIDIPDGETCDKINETNGTVYKKWDSNSDELAELGSSGKMTYSFWLKVNPANFYKTSYNGPRCILAKGTITPDGDITNPCPAFWILNDGFTSRLWCLVYTEGGPRNGEGILIEDFPLNELFQLCMTVDGRSMNIFINGELIRTTVLSGSLMTNNSDLIKAPIQIDGNGTTPDNKGFLGCINLLRVGNMVFTPEQIRKFYENEKSFILNKISSYVLTGEMNKCVKICS